MQLEAHVGATVRLADAFFAVAVSIRIGRTPTLWVHEGEFAVFLLNGGDDHQGAADVALWWRLGIFVQAVGCEGHGHGEYA